MRGFEDPCRPEVPKDPMPAEPLLLAVVGPTACGKSAAGLALAEWLGAEIVSVDAIQVYRGMNVGSAKPPPAWRRAVPHHMIDVLDPWEECSAGWYREHALRAIAEITDRGRPVILVGGSPLYYFALTTDLPLHPPAPSVRSELQERMARSGLLELAEELRAVAPAVFEEIDSANPRRVVRALEIAKTRRSWGQSADGWYRGVEYYCSKGRSLIGIGLSIPSAAHRRRIEARSAEMVSGGLVEEVGAIFGAGAPTPAASAAAAVGYRQVRECLVEGLGRDRMVEAVTSATWKLARRQRAWFRRDKRLCWFSSEEPSAMLGAIKGFVQAGLASLDLYRPRRAGLSRAGAAAGSP